MSYYNNLIIINNINNKNYNLDLFSSNSILIKNCDNLIINIKNKINKITIENSNKIYINIIGLIVGFEISKSKYIIILNKYNNNIPMMNLYKSDVYLHGSIDNYNNLLLINEFSNLYSIEIL